MGKMGRNPLRNRKKYNLPGSADNDNDSGRHRNGQEPIMQSDDRSIKGSMFSGISIDTSKITQKLDFPDIDDRLSTTSKRPRLWEPYKQTKEAKRLEKKANFGRMVMAQQKEREEEKKTSRRKQTVIVGDMKPILDTLPVIKSVVSGHGNELKSAQTSKASKSFKQRQKELMSDIEIFRQVQEHPSFKTDPTSTMLEHLQNKFHPST